MKPINIDLSMIPEEERADYVRPILDEVGARAREIKAILEEAMESKELVGPEKLLEFCQETKSLLEQAEIILKQPENGLDEAVCKEGLSILPAYKFLLEMVERDLKENEL